MTRFERLLPPLATLVAFEAAVRHRNFSRAAEELFQSQATVSRRVRELEDDLGVRLFERGRYDVTPTFHAEELVVAVRLALSELSSTADRIRRDGAASDSLTVLTSMSLASVMVAPILGRLQHRHPELQIRVVSSCEPVETVREQFDVAIQYGTSESARFHAEFITAESVFPVCAPGFADRLPTPLTAEDLNRFPLLHVEYDDPSWVTWADVLTTLDPAQPSTEPGMVLTSYDMCLDMAEGGNGLALGWERSVAPRIEAGRLVPVPGLMLADAAQIYAYRTEQAADNPHVDEFVLLLKEAVAAD